MTAMSHRSHRFPLQLPRVALLALLALGVIAQSLIATMGDLHESVLHANAGEAYTHQHAGHADDAHGDATGEPADPDQGDALHALQHQSCGGHCAWIAAETLFTARLSEMATPLPIAATRHIPAADYTAPFRPPISA